MMTQAISAGGDVTAHRDIKCYVTHITCHSVTQPIKMRDSFRSVPMPIRNFTGRKELLESIHIKLQQCLPEKHFMNRIVALVGLGGMGKSETAKQLAHQYREFYKNVAWIDAETQTSIETSFSQLAQAIGLTFQAGTNGLAKLVYRQLSQQLQGPTLFIFNNAKQLRTKDNDFGIFKYLPSEDIENPPLILLTSQTVDWGRDCKMIEIINLRPEATALFLRSRFKLTQEDFRQCCELENVLLKLVDKLDGYPLALGRVASNTSYVPGKTSLQLLRQDLQKHIRLIDENQVLGQEMGASLISNSPCTVVRVLMNAMRRRQWQRYGQRAERLRRILAYGPKLYQSMTSPIYYLTCCELQGKCGATFQRALDELRKVGWVILVKMKGSLLDRELRVHRLAQTMANTCTSRSRIQKVLLLLIVMGWLWSKWPQGTLENYIWSDGGVNAWALENYQTTVLWLTGLKVKLEQTLPTRGGHQAVGSGVHFVRSCPKVTNQSCTVRLVPFLFTACGAASQCVAMIGNSLTLEVPSCDDQEIRIQVDDSNSTNDDKLVVSMENVHPKLLTASEDAVLPEYCFEISVQSIFAVKMNLRVGMFEGKVLNCTTILVR